MAAAAVDLMWDGIALLVFCVMTLCLTEVDALLLLLPLVDVVAVELGCDGKFGLIFCRFGSVAFCRGDDTIFDESLFIFFEMDLSSRCSVLLSGSGTKVTEKSLIKSLLMSSVTPKDFMASALRFLMEDVVEPLLVVFLDELPLLLVVAGVSLL